MSPPSVRNEGGPKKLTQMGVIPERSSLVVSVEVVEEAVPLGNRTLSHESGAISPRGVLHEESVPVLLER